MGGKILQFPPATVLSSQPSLAPLVGRAAELELLHQRLETALEGQRQVVFLSGEPGIGKTALAEAFLAPIRERANILIVSGQCIEQYGAGEAYLPLLEALSYIGRRPEGREAIAALACYAPTWLAQLPTLVSIPPNARRYNEPWSARRGSGCYESWPPRWSRSPRNAPWCWSSKICTGATSRRWTG